MPHPLGVCTMIKCTEHLQIKTEEVAFPAFYVVLVWKYFSWTGDSQTILTISHINRDKIIKKKNLNGLFYLPIPISTEKKKHQWDCMLALARHNILIYFMVHQQTSMGHHCHTWGTLPCSRYLSCKYLNDYHLMETIVKIELCLNSWLCQTKCNEI